MTGSRPLLFLLGFEARERLVDRPFVRFGGGRSFDAKLLQDVYLRAAPRYTGRVAVPVANLLVLRDEGADSVRRALIAMNDRLRASASRPGMQVVLFVYGRWPEPGIRPRFGHGMRLDEE